MANKHTLRNLVMLWAAWFVILYGFQWLVIWRLEISRPDYAVFWSAHETQKLSNQGKDYLLEPFLNRQVAWDSEYYLEIATSGYDDPHVGRAKDPVTGTNWPKNYSFFPGYPMLMKLVMIPLRILKLNSIATAAMAGVIVAFLGTLAGLTALWDLTRAYFYEDDTLRAAFYMLIFPSAFFFAQIYTEGLFIGLSFWSLALSRRKRWFWAGVLAFFATWTRAHGGLLFIPLGIAWLRDNDRRTLPNSLSWKSALQGVCAFLPLHGSHSGVIQTWEQAGLSCNPFILDVGC
ncbi:MAG TPA: mannosyltransferase family protein [Anaerolineales bacterium]|jgi:Gpi18-like mannosyltransferase